MTRHKSVTRITGVALGLGCGGVGSLASLAGRPGGAASASVKKTENPLKPNFLIFSKHSFQTNSASFSSILARRLKKCWKLQMMGAVMKPPSSWPKAQLAKHLSFRDDLCCRPGLEKEAKCFLVRHRQAGHIVATC